MGSFIHSVHQYIVLLAKYLLILVVIGSIPIPLFTFLGGDSLSEADYNPLYEYFNHYEISTDTILDNVYTNVFISQSKNDIKEWQVDNAILWADALAYRLIEEDIPVVKKVISTGNPGKIQSLKAIHEDASQIQPLVPPQIGDLLLTVKEKIQLLLPAGSVTQSARQWIIVALNSNEKAVKKELKILANRYPNDNFLVVSQTPFALSKKYLSLQLPDFNIKQAKRVISEGLKISDKQAEILLIENQHSLWALTEDNEENIDFSLKSLLGNNYQTLNNLLSKEEKVLQELCKSGKAKVGKKALDLSDYGVVIKGNNYQWENDEAELNYRLQKQTLCGKQTWVDVEQTEENQTQQLKFETEAEKKETNQSEVREDKQEEKNKQEQKPKKKSEKKEEQNEEKKSQQKQEKNQEKKQEKQIEEKVQNITEPENQQL